MLAFHEIWADKSTRHPPISLEFRFFFNFLCASNSFFVRRYLLLGICFPIQFVFSYPEKKSQLLDICFLLLEPVVFLFSLKHMQVECRFWVARRKETKNKICVLVYFYFTASGFLLLIHNIIYSVLIIGYII